MLSSLKILVIQFKVFLYTRRASIDCILPLKSTQDCIFEDVNRTYRVLTVSRGIVTYLDTLLASSYFPKLINLILTL